MTPSATRELQATCTCHRGGPSVIGSIAQVFIHPFIAQDILHRHGDPNIQAIAQLPLGSEIHRVMVLTIGHMILCCLLLATTHAHTVQLFVEISYALIGPVGNGLKIGIIANSTFPGPQIIAQVGDDVEFLVRNRLKQDTAIHFHGIHQASSPWSDGTPGVSQVAIKPGAAYLYCWRAGEAGVFFYHGHSRGQIMDGLYGAILIKASDETETPFHLISADRDAQQAMRRAEADIQPLLIADYTQLWFEEFDQAQNDANVEILCMDAIVLNGGVSSPSSFGAKDVLLKTIPGFGVLSPEERAGRTHGRICLDSHEDGQDAGRAHE